MKNLPYQAYPNLLNNLFDIPESRGVAVDRALDRLHDALCHCDKSNRRAFEDILGSRIMFELELWAKTKYGLEDELLHPDTRKYLQNKEMDVVPFHWEILSKVKDSPDNLTPSELQLFKDPNR